MKCLQKLLFLFVAPLIIFLAGCGTPALSQQPTTLQVIRVSTDNDLSNSWTITDANSVQRLLQEIQNLPLHQNKEADSCVKSRYEYTLHFFAGQKSIQKDDLYTYCSTLTMEDGSHHDPTATFDTLLLKMLSVRSLR